MISVVITALLKISHLLSFNVLLHKVENLQFRFYLNTKINNEQ